MSLNNCEINLKLIWSQICFISNSTGSETYEITGTKHLCFCSNSVDPRQYKTKGQLKSRFKIVINWKDYSSEFKSYTQNRHLNYLIDPSFKGVNRFFLLNKTCRILSSSRGNKKAKTLWLMAGGFHHPVANNIRTYEIIRKITTGNWDDYITGIRRLVGLHILQEKLKNDRVRPGSTTRT